MFYACNDRIELQVYKTIDNCVIITSYLSNTKVNYTNSGELCSLLLSLTEKNTHNDT